MIIQVFADPMTHPFVVYEDCADEFVRTNTEAGEAVDSLKFGETAEFFTGRDGERYLIIKMNIKEAL